MIRKFFVFILLLGASINANATQQFNESLIYKGQSLALFSTPLEGYFNEQHPRPVFPQTCTGEWKGYHGTWEIKDGELYLVSLQKPCPSEGDPDVFSEEIFQRKPPIKADWVSGFMRVAYEDKSIAFTFEKGKLVSEEMQDYSPYRDGGPYGIPNDFDSPNPYSTQVE